MGKIYACIDLKSFYASVECVERGLDPLDTNLVVADLARTEKTICLAVSPSLKKYGIGGRARLYEIISKVKDINYLRKKNNRFRKFSGKSYIDSELKKDLSLELDYIVASPRMKYYMDYSNRIYNIYLRYVSCNDIYVYSIDEVFIDITGYLKYNNIKAREFVTKLIKKVYFETGITATGGIGSNMYLAKVSMDIVAKHMKPDECGVRIAGLDEISYRKLLWNYKPITDFWRVGRGIADKLYKNNIYTMGEIAKISLDNEELFFKLFGINAELLIDHAWGYEPTQIQDIKNYNPVNKSITSGQVLHEPYNYKDTLLIIREMADLLSLDLVAKKLKCKMLVLTIGYDISNIKNGYDGVVVKDRYDREIPKHSHGTINLDFYSSSSSVITDNLLKLYNRIVDKGLLIRRINIVAGKLISENDVLKCVRCEQLDIFSNVTDDKIKKDINFEEEELRVQRVILDIKNKYGKNAMIKGMNLSSKGTTIDRNGQVGGHHE